MLNLESTKFCVLVNSFDFYIFKADWYQLSMCYRLPIRPKYVITSEFVFISHDCIILMAKLQNKVIKKEGKIIYQNYKVKILN